MSQTLNTSINIDRLWKRHNEIAEFGQIYKTGVNRQALSNEEMSARHKLVEWAKKIGLEVSVDEVSNIFFKLVGERADQPSVMTGSHIDSQPTGGRYDGTLGVLAGLEVLEFIIENGIKIQKSIEVVSWMNEEGSRFAPGMMGSGAFSGSREISDILKTKDSNGISVSSEITKMTREFVNETKIIKCGRALHSFIELHIEQGPILEKEKKIIGIVSGMQGKKTFMVQILGKEDHVGTCPKSLRKDALLATINIISELERCISGFGDAVRFTVGRLSVQPNAPSVVPREVEFSIDLRHPNDAVLKLIGEEIERIIQKFSHPCQSIVKALVDDLSVEFPEMICKVIENQTKQLGFRYMRLNSGAGHDSKHITKVCPTGMIFIPCRKGISHHPAEFVKKKDMFAGTMVLAKTLIELANQKI